jgi:hypothetical protein
MNTGDRCRRKEVKGQAVCKTEEKMGIKLFKDIYR